MVSTIEFFSIKQFKLSGVKARWQIFLGLLIVLTWYKAALGLLVLTGVYAASGPYAKVRPRLPKWLGGVQSAPAHSQPSKVVVLSKDQA